MIEKPFTCGYCKHSFVYEKTFTLHVCEPKRRALAKNEKHVLIAFDAYRRFYRISMKLTKDKTYEDFCNSQYYTAFVKFGSYINNVKPLYPDSFIDYIIRSGTRIDHWCRDEVYDKYVVELIRRESVETALERSITTMIGWADNTNSQWDRYFYDASLSRATFDIKDGKISPWLILNCDSGKNMLKNMDDQQLNMITAAINPQFWLLKFKRNQKDLTLVTNLVKDSHL